MQQLPKSEQPLGKQKSPEELLLEIRNIMSPKEKEPAPKHLASEQIEQILKASFDNYKQIQQENSKTHLKERAKEAISIVQNHHPQPFVYQYTKQKIFSEMFFNLRGPFSEEESRSYELQREELLKQRQLQEEEERKRQAQAIASRKKFLRYQSNDLPLNAISQLRMKEGEASLHYLVNQSAEKHQSSANNLIKQQGEGEQLEKKFQEMKKGIVSHSDSARLLRDEAQEFFEVVDESVDQGTHRHQIEESINQVLKDSPKLTEVLKQLVRKAVAHQKYMRDSRADRNNRNSIIRSSGSYKYTGQTQLFSKDKERIILDSVLQLTKTYNSKGVVLHGQSGKSILKEELIICQKTISKMKGESQDFHNKKVRLTEDEISWCEEGQTFSESCKRLLLVIQQVRVESCYKEEGSFFSSRKKQVDIVHVYGKKRGLKFQLNYLEGRELYKELCLLMARKIIELNMIVKHRLNPELVEYVNREDSTLFSLACSPLQDYQKYPDKEYRLMIINILTDLFPWRPNVSHLNLLGVRFNLLQTGLVIKAISPLVNLTKIQISQTKFNQPTLTSLLNHVSKLDSQAVELTLQECFIDDDLFIKVKDSLVACTNIEKLDISSNDITLQGFGVLIDLAGQPNCCLKELNVSRCKIVNLISLGALIKRAKKLEVVYAEECGFNFGSREELTSFFHCLLYRKLRKISLLRNDVVSDLHLFEELWTSDNVEEIAIDVGTFAEKTSKHLQGKIIS